MLLCLPNLFKLTVTCVLLFSRLGMNHDGDETNLDCPPLRNIMSPSLFPVTPSTLSTYHLFSSCSTENVVNHLNTYVSNKP